MQQCTGHPDSVSDGRIIKLVERIKKSIQRTSSTDIRSEQVVSSSRFDGIDSWQKQNNLIPYTLKSKAYTRPPAEWSASGQAIHSYQFNRRFIGYAIIIVNRYFDSQNERLYADNDCTNMRRLFETFGFEIKVLQNKTNTELKRNIIEIRDSIGDNHDCMVCVVSSHGSEMPLSKHSRQHVIYTKDSSIPTEEILQEFDNDHCENLIGKPKMFFIQACRCGDDADEVSRIDAGFDAQISQRTVTGIESQIDYNFRRNVTKVDGGSTGSKDIITCKISAEPEGGSDDKYYGNDTKLQRLNSRNQDLKGNDYTTFSSKENDSVCIIPCYEDFLVMFASSSGKLGWSDPGKGGWLMHCLYTVFESLVNTNYRTDLLQILTGVCRKMAYELESKCIKDIRYHSTKSAAVIYHMLTKDIYLQPKFYRMVQKPMTVRETYI